MLTRSYPLLALESNGLRVLLRLGFADEKKSYSASYRGVQQALAGQLPSQTTTPSSPLTNFSAGTGRNCANERARFASLAVPLLRTAVTSKLGERGASAF